MEDWIDRNYLKLELMLWRKILVKVKLIGKLSRFRNKYWGKFSNNKQKKYKVKVKFNSQVKYQHK